MSFVQNKFWNLKKNYNHLDIVIAQNTILVMWLVDDGDIFDSLHRHINKLRALPGKNLKPKTQRVILYNIVTWS